MSLDDHLPWEIVIVSDAHYRVLWFAADGADPAAPVGGLWTWIGGERVWQIPPLAPEAAQTAAVELLDAGCLQVHRLTGHTKRWECLADEEARRFLADLGHPDRDEPQPPSRVLYELGLTPAGWELWAEAQRRFGHEFERVQRMHDEEFAAFLERHPDFEEKRQAFFDAMGRWVEKGGRQPKWPWKYPDWPYPDSRSRTRRRT